MELTKDQLKFIAFDAFKEQDQHPMAREAISLLYDRKLKTYKYFVVVEELKPIQLKPHAQVVKEAVRGYSCKECEDKGFVPDPFWEWPATAHNIPCPLCYNRKHESR